jgi:periplasmic divalent cation tolerance protein
MTRDAAMTPEVFFVVTTVASAAEADALAERLVGSRLAACVNQLPGVRSVFRWKGTVDRGDEVILLIKTLGSRLEELERVLKEHHPYELPEIVALKAAHVEAEFARWIVESCSTESA